MVKAASTMLPLGTRAPDFRLPNVDGSEVARADLAAAPASVVMFLCNHCPFVVHIRDAVVQFAKDAMHQGVAVVAINSNDVEAYPDDSPEAMRAEADRYGFTFPYLYDESQSVAKAFRAACTPEFYLFDGQQKLVYRGRFDGSGPRNDLAVTGAELRAAVDAVLSGTTVGDHQSPSVGCNIKWKPGNQPDYFG